MNENFLEYSKKLKLGKDFLKEYNDILFTSKEDYLVKIFEVHLIIEK